MALDSKPCSQKWRNNALQTAYRAVIDHEAILRQIPAKEKTLTSPPLVYHARIHPFKRSPIMLRPRNSRKARNSCGSADIIVHEDPHKMLKHQASKGLIHASLVLDSHVLSNHHKRLKRAIPASDHTAHRHAY